MQRLYNRLRPGNSKGDRVIPLVSEKQSGSHPATVIKSGVPSKTSIRTGLGPGSPGLEGLAVELQWEILQKLACLPSLDAIVHASPFYHRAYMARRQSILAKVISRDIGTDVLFEAQALALALKINKKDGSEIRDFFEDYKNRRREPTSVSLESVPLPDTVILSQVQYAVRFAVKDFCQATISRHPMSREKAQDITPLTTNEAQRINRAFYRFEIFCTIFRNQGFNVRPGLDCMDMCHLFLNQFPPWEVEEIACVRDYIMDRYAQLFAKHMNELAQPAPEWAYEDSSGEDHPFEGDI